MNYLVVVAHPDDEVLGAGATIKKLTRDGHSVDICIMCSEAKARAFRPDDNELNDDLDASSKMLGIRNKYAGNFPNIEMNNATHLSLVQFIEKAIIASNCDVVITHHPSDTNNDHMHTSNGLSSCYPSVSTPCGGETFKGVPVYGGTLFY